MDLTPLKSDQGLLRSALEQAGVERWSGDGRRQCRCPFHDDKRPSAGIHLAGSTWLFSCLGCGTSGDVIRVIALSRGVSDGEVLRHLTESGELLGGLRPSGMFESRKPERQREPDYQGLAAETDRWIAAASPDWLEETAGELHVTADALALYGWGHNTQIECAAAPMRDAEDRICGIRYRWPADADGKAAKKSRTGSKNGLFCPAQPPANAKVLWIAEGATDPVALASIGLWAVGLPAARQGIDVADAYCDRYGPSAVVVMTDANPAGRASATLTARALLPRVVKTIEAPTGATDVRAWIKRRREDGASDKAMRRALLGIVAATRPTRPEIPKSAKPAPSAAPCPLEAMRSEYAALVARSANQPPDLRQVLLWTAGWLGWPIINGFGGEQAWRSLATRAAEPALVRAICALDRDQSPSCR